jgi:hypothetical protein
MRALIPQIGGIALPPEIGIFGVTFGDASRACIGKVKRLQKSGFENQNVDIGMNRYYQSVIAVGCAVR